MVEILKLMLGRDSEDKFDQDLCLNFDMNSTLGSVVPLAMFSTRPNFSANLYIFSGMSVFNSVFD